jgi:hypothetical protein
MEDPTPTPAGADATDAAPKLSARARRRAWKIKNGLLPANAGQPQQKKVKAPTGEGDGDLSASASIGSTRPSSSGGGGGGGGDGEGGGEGGGEGEEATKGKRKRKRRRKGRAEDGEGGGEGEDDEEQKAVAEEEATRAVEEDPVLESTVFVQGISYDAKDQDLRDFFSSCGDIMALRMPRWQDSGKPMGYAHVEFASAADAAGAIKLSGEYMLSRYLDISAAKPRAADLHAVTVRGG